LQRFSRKWVNCKIRKHNMKNKIEVISWCTMYSIIKVYKGNEISEHRVSNNGWLPLEYWKKYFENEF